MNSAQEREMANNTARPVTRRELLGYIWAASMALALAQAGGITFLFTMPRFRAGEFGGVIDEREDGFTPAGAPPEPNNVGKYFKVALADGLVAHYRVCPHLGCLYTWSESGGHFHCPCHGSQFAVDGEWLAGPAARGLDRFVIQAVDGEGEVLAASADHAPFAVPEGAAGIRVDTGQRIMGRSHF